MEEDIGKSCEECGKIWTKEDEEKLTKEVKDSMTVTPIKPDYKI